jgi:hypothetical protein
MLKVAEKKLTHPDHPLKEFAEEMEPKIRQCLFCEQTAPLDIPTSAMILTGSRKGWYSNALLSPDGMIARFYLCPSHHYRTSEAWEWVCTDDYKGV